MPLVHALQDASGVARFPIPETPDASSSADTPPLFLQRLLAAAVPSPYGSDNETVYGSSCRTALELPASKVGLSASFPPWEVLDQIRTLLQPSAAAVVPELDKVNMYGPGCFFKPHFDTPRSPDMFGTLVVCLPSTFQGKSILARHASESARLQTRCIE